MLRRAPSHPPAAGPPRSRHSLSAEKERTELEDILKSADMSKYEGKWRYDDSQVEGWASLPFSFGTLRVETTGKAAPVTLFSAAPSFFIKLDDTLIAEMSAPEVSKMKEEMEEAGSIDVVKKKCKDMRQPCVVLIALCRAMHAEPFCKEEFWKKSSSGIYFHPFHDEEKAEMEIIYKRRMIERAALQLAR